MKKANCVREKLLRFIRIDENINDVKKLLTPIKDFNDINKLRSMSTGKRTKTLKQTLQISKIDNEVEEKENFKKYINEIGKYYIDMRKENIGRKKLKMKTIKLDTSIKDAIEIKLTNKKNNKKINHTKEEVIELFMSNEEKEAVNIQKKYGLLHDMVSSFKKDVKEIDYEYEFDTGEHTKINEEMFGILAYRGMIDPKHFHKIKVSKSRFSNFEMYEKKFEFFNSLFSPIGEKQSVLGDKGTNENFKDNLIINLLSCSDVSRKDTDNMSNLNLSNSQETMSENEASSLSEVSNDFVMDYN
jgi:hypothetical protein